MNRKDFMRRLEELLMDIPLEERVEAMAFYHSYFEDAGEENEERVIRELESPEKVAAIIKEEMNLESAGQEESQEEEYALVKDTRAEEASGDGEAQAGDGAQAGGYTQAGDGAQAGGYTQAGSGAQAGDSWFGGNGQGSGYQGGKEKEDNTVKIVLIVIAAILTSPLWLAALGALFGLVMGAFGVVFGIIVAVVAVAFSLYLAGFALCAASFVAFGAGGAAVGLGLLGAGLLVLAFAVLGTLLCVWMFGTFAPWAVRGIVSLCRKLFQKKHKGGYAA